MTIERWTAVSPLGHPEYQEFENKYFFCCRIAFQIILSSRIPHILHQIQPPGFIDFESLTWAKMNQLLLFSEINTRPNEIEWNILLWSESVWMDDIGILLHSPAGSSLGSMGHSWNRLELKSFAISIDWNINLTSMLKHPDSWLCILQHSSSAGK